MKETISLAEHGIHVEAAFRNLSVAELYETALRDETGSQIAASGALVALSGSKTGRSPGDKRIVKESSSEADIWWGPVNVAIDRETFETNRERAQDYLNVCPRLYVVDGYAGWEERHRIKVRVICARAYHALFMHNMLIRPTPEQLATFSQPDFVVFNAGRFPANSHTMGMSSKTSIDIDFASRELVILGTEYAGEMKKGIFTVMNYLMPKRGVLSMHCSATEARDGGSSSILFGLSGTGKTTLSADPKRRLIGDDEHCWFDDGIFNIEGGCYAKTANLTEEQEPDIYRALRFGAILENVVLDPRTRAVVYEDTSITKNTRGAYPVEFIENAKIPCLTTHPKDVIFLTCDAFGVMPPVAKLDPYQAMYHFISGYTAKVAGTEVGISEPEVAFSPCFGGPFLVWHPAKYAELLAERLRRHRAQCWLLNTGWTGGAVGEGHRIPLRVTRALLDAIHDGRLAEVPTQADPVFGLQVPRHCPGVDSSLLNPRATWTDGQRYDATAKHLAELFRKNFEPYRSGVAPEVAQAGPRW